MEEIQICTNENKISTKYLKVCQSIQYICDNCSKLRSDYDNIATSTVYQSYDNDNQRQQFSDENVITKWIDEIDELFK